MLGEGKEVWDRSQRTLQEQRDANVLPPSDFVQSLHLMRCVRITHWLEPGDAQDRLSTHLR